MISRKQTDIKQSEAEKAIAFANAGAKTRYDKKHKPINMDVGDEAYLKLHHGYTIPGLTNRKLSPQRAGPFRILRKVGALAYKLKLPPVIKIHPVISIAQLEPAPKKPDPYGRKHTTDPGLIQTKNDATTPIPDAPSYEISRILNERISQGGKTQYLVQWKGYDQSNNVWYDEKDLDNAREAIQDYKNRLSSRPTPRRFNKKTRRIAARS